MDRKCTEEPVLGSATSRLQNQEVNYIICRKKNRRGGEGKGEEERGGEGESGDGGGG